MTNTRTIRRVGAAAVTAATCFALAGLHPAQAAPAETLYGNACDEVDYAVAPGTTVVLSFDGCSFDGYTIESGSPTVVVETGSDGQPLIWYQSVGRSSDAAPCADGWEPSWAQWPHEGTGGPVCNRQIDWGTGPGEDGPLRLRVTTSTWTDWVAVRSDGYPWVFGCNNTTAWADAYDDFVTNCT